MAFRPETTVYQYLLDVREKRGAGFFVLLDPDRSPVERAVEQAHRCVDAGVDALLVGSSLLMRDGFDEYIGSIADAADTIPVLVFPGDRGQVSPSASAILYLSLLSGRNPEFIIGEQIRSAPVIKSLGLEPISTAYLLVESGKMTSVEYMSATKPIPSDKPEIALSHAIAAEFFGMKLVYLEAGSGALRPVSDEMVASVSRGADIPVVVGGGIRSPETVAAKVAAGASFVVIGNHLESDGYDDLGRFVDAAHTIG